MAEKIEEPRIIVEVKIEEPVIGRVSISPELGEPPACYLEAMKWIKKKMEDDATTVGFQSDLNVYPMDGAYALFQVLKKKFGWIEQTPTWDKPPAMIEVQTDFGEFTQVPWGEMMVPGVAGKLKTAAKKERGIWKFVLHGTVIKMHLHIVDEIIAETKAYVRNHSIYRGKNVRLEWSDGSMFDEPAFDFPQFLKQTHLVPSDLILSKDLQDEVQAGLFSLILNTKLAQTMGVPTKRLTILAGEYGTGKTLTAAIVGELCRQTGRTYIYLADIRHLSDAIRFSTQYSPALIFGEDIDTITDEEEIDELSNTVDGVDTKNLDVMMILTTNHLSSIPKKFLRPGRSDLIIEFEAPDARAAGALLVKYAGANLDPSFSEDDARSLGEELSGMIAASIREVAERAKLFAIGQNRSKIQKIDFHLAAKGVRRQGELLKKKPSSEYPKGWTELGVVLKRGENGDHNLQEMER